MLLYPATAITMGFLLHLTSRMNGLISKFGTHCHCSTKVEHRPKTCFNGQLFDAIVFYHNFTFQVTIRHRAGI